MGLHTVLGGYLWVVPLTEGADDVCGWRSLVDLISLAKASQSRAVAETFAQGSAQCDCEAAEGRPQ